MGRAPTPAEIRETNPNVTLECSKCETVMRLDANYGTFKNSLTLTMSGGYDEYVDSAVIKNEELEFNLCHKCAHELMAQFFPDWSFSHWHPLTKDKYCDGWSIPTVEEMYYG